MYEYQQPATIRAWFTNGKSKTFNNIKYTDQKPNACQMITDNNRTIILNWQNINFIEEE